MTLSIEKFFSSRSHFSGFLHFCPLFCAIFYFIFFFVRILLFSLRYPLFFIQYASRGKEVRSQLVEHCYRRRISRAAPLFINIFSFFFLLATDKIRVNVRGCTVTAYLHVPNCILKLDFKCRICLADIMGPAHDIHQNHSL